LGCTKKRKGAYEKPNSKNIDCIFSEPFDLKEWQKASQVGDGPEQD